MRYVQRDKDRKVVAHFSHPNAVAQEEVPDDHPDVVAYQAEVRSRLRAVTPTEARIRRLEAAVAELERKLAEQRR